MDLKTNGAVDAARSDVLEQLQLLRSLDALDEQLTDRKQQLNQLQVGQEMFDQNQVLLQSFEWLNKFTNLLEQFLQKESAISLFLLQNVTQNKHEVKLRLPVASHSHFRQLLHNLAQFDESHADTQG
jgi:hypothetical protein